MKKRKSSRSTIKEPPAKSTVQRSQKGKSLSTVFPVVGIGASAGGLEAVTELLKHLPAGTGMAFILVQHLSPTHESELKMLLGRVTPMEVHDITQNLRIKPNNIYIIPANSNLRIVKGVLKLSPRDSRPGTPRTIDSFFESLALDQSDRAIGIILSGTATDGTLGLEAIKAEGGITFAQDKTAKDHSMPRNAISAGCVDLVLSPQKMARELARIATHPGLAGNDLLQKEAERFAVVRHEKDVSPVASGGHGTPPTGARLAREEAENPMENGDDRFQAILLLLRKHSGVDFSLYKSSTIQRRITRRMILNKFTLLEEYAAFLKRQPKELDALYSDVLISVTSFFRNPEAFDLLKQKVFPKIFADTHQDAIRVWILGCATGQEAYSLAMILQEYLDKLTRKPKIQIFATDLNDALLNKARAALYSKSLAQDISPERLRRFFVEEDGGYRARKQLREMVVFARQNLLHDPPFSRMNLISCRNVLIYLDGSFQKKIIPTFHYALKPKGFLFLGASESVGSFTDLFDPLDRKHKIYIKKPAATPSVSMNLSALRLVEKKTSRHFPLTPPPQGFHPELNAQREADRIALSRYVPPSVLVNSDLQVLHFRGDTSQFLKPPSGKPTFSLLQIAKEGLMMPLRAALNKAIREKKTVRKEGIRSSNHGQAIELNIEIVPIKNLKEHCYLIFFEDASRYSGRIFIRKSDSISQRSGPPASTNDALRQRVAELDAELSETRDYLQSIQEAYEAMNEEIQASNEEVTSANEELQSTNEELETSKEELESSNEELTTVNEETVRRNDELSRSNSDLSNLYVNVNMPIIVLARDLTIRRFTPPAEKLFNLMANDLGRSISTIRSNLDLPDLDDLVAKVIDSVSFFEREVQARDGHWHLLRIRPYLTLDNKIDGAVVVAIDINRIKRSEQESKAARENAEATLSAAPVPLLVLDGNLRVEMANEAFYKTFKTSAKETLGSLVYELGNGQWNIPKLRSFLEEIIPRNSFFLDWEVTHDFATIGKRTMSLNARRFESSGPAPHRILLAINDFTLRIEAEAALRVSERRFRRLFEAARDGILLLDPVSGKITDANPFMSELLGYSHDEFLGCELWQIGLLKDEQASRSALGLLHQQGLVRMNENLVRTKSGSECHLEIIANRYQEDGHEVIQCNVRDITERKRAEMEIWKAKEELELANRSLEERVQARTAELNSMNTRLQQLSKRLIKAQEDERERIARELHDEIGQGLTGLKLHIQHTREQPLPGALDQIQAIVSDVMHRVRQISLELHPQVLGDLGLKAALEWHFKTYQAHTRIEVDFQCPGLAADSLSRDAELAVFRLVQEALTNVARHSGSKTVEVELFKQNGAIHLNIRDAGRGFDVSQILPHATAGLTGMQERVMLLGGEFAITSVPGTGTALSITFPSKPDAGGNS